MQTLGHVFFMESLSVVRKVMATNAFVALICWINNSNNIVSLHLHFEILVLFVICRLRVLAKLLGSKYLHREIRYAAVAFTSDGMHAMF